MIRPLAVGLGTAMLAASPVLLVPSGSGFENPATTTLNMSTQAVAFGSDPADAGDLRLENATSICWEASPAGTDVCMAADAAEGMVFTGLATTFDVGSVNVRSAGFYLDASDAYGLDISGGTATILQAGGATAVRAVTNGLDRMTLQQQDLTATCTLGALRYDTGGSADELCYCQATDTWMCVTVTAGPAD